MIANLNWKGRRGLMVAAGFTLLLALLPAQGVSQEDGIRTRRIWKGDPSRFCCNNTLVSADGRYVPGWEWSTGDLAYLDMMEDRWVSVTKKGTWDENDSFSLNGMFSPDGLWLAHTWSNADREAGTAIAELRLDRVDGSEHRVLLSGQVAAPLGWTPDSRMVLAVVRRVEDPDPESYFTNRGRKGWDQLALVSIDDSQVRILKEFEMEGEVDGRMALTPSPSGLAAAGVSPDGQWVAFQQYEEGTARADIHFVSIDGEVERPLVTGNGNDRLLGWLPDGSGILFHSGREVRQGIWRLQVRDGQSVREPEYVRGEVFGMEPLGLGSKGLYYMVRTENPQVFTAEVDFERGELISAPAPVRNPASQGPSLSPAWSPDGRQLAYWVYTSEDGVGGEIEIHSLETGEVRTFSFPGFGAEKISWGPDPRSLLVNGSERNGAWGIHRFDLQSSELSLVLSGEEAGVYLERGLKRDGRSVVRKVPVEGGGERIEVVDLEADEVRVILESEDGFPRFGVASFPGADRYAVWIGRRNERGDGIHGHLLQVNADGTGERTIWEGETASFSPDQVAVTSDGSHVLLVVGEGAMIVDVDTGDSRFLKTPSGEDFGLMGDFVIQPNGSRLAFVGGTPGAEIWLMEGIW